MTRSARLVMVLARPAVIILFGLFAATGLAEAGRANNVVLLTKALVVVIAFLLFSVVVNDLADEAIDVVNLPGDRRRPLVAGTGTRRQFVVIALTAAVMAVSGAALLHWPAVVVVLAGLGLSVSYSLHPVRLADRGAVASLVLPAGYVAVPYLVGIFSVRSSLTGTDLALLGGLYVGFVGRILLKDFRDVRGDALFGKRTFLVRYGRRWTCAFSALCWTLGMVTLAAVRGVTPALIGAFAVYLVVALGLLRALSVERGARRDEALVAAIAIVGRGMIVSLLAHFSMTAAHWSPLGYQTVMVLLTAIMVGQAASMARRGPRTRLTLPPDFAAAVVSETTGSGEVDAAAKTAVTGGLDTPAAADSLSLDAQAPGDAAGARPAPARWEPVPRQQDALR